MPFCLFKERESQFSEGLVIYRYGPRLLSGSDTLAYCVRDIADVTTEWPIYYATVGASAIACQQSTAERAAHFHQAGLTVLARKTGTVKSCLRLAGNVNVPAFRGSSEIQPANYPHCPHCPHRPRCCRHQDRHCRCPRRFLLHHWYSHSHLHHHFR